MRLYVSLRPNEATLLTALAERERRDPRDQAAYLIARALKRDRIGSPERRPTEREEAPR
jgi:hypothetical protein